MFAPQQLDAIAAAVRGETVNPLLQHSVIQCLVAWFKAFPNDPFVTKACEKPFAVPMQDLKGRDFWFVGRRDYEGTHKLHGDLFLGEFKTHRGPWRKIDTVDKMLTEWWEGWRLNLQAAMYLYSLRRDYPGELQSLRYLVRVAVKPGQYNSAECREKWFQFDPGVWQQQVDGFRATVTQILDTTIYATSDQACFSKYNKRCPYWGPCQNKAPFVQLRPWTHHLTHIDALTPKWPAFDVTSVRLFRECPRKWAYRYIDKLEPLDSEALEEGRAFHAGLDAAHR